MNIGDRVRVKLTSADDQDYTLPGELTNLDRVQGVFYVHLDNGTSVNAGPDEIEADRDPEVTDFYVGQDVSVGFGDHRELGTVAELQDHTGYVKVNVDDEFLISATPDEVEAL